MITNYMGYVFYKDDNLYHVVNVVGNKVYAALNGNVGGQGVFVFEKSDISEIGTIIDLDVLSRCDATDGITELHTGDDIAVFGYPAKVTGVWNINGNKQYYLKFESGVFEISGECFNSDWYDEKLLLHSLFIWKLDKGIHALKNAVDYSFRHIKDWNRVSNFVRIDNDMLCDSNTGIIYLNRDNGICPYLSADGNPVRFNGINIVDTKTGKVIERKLYF